MTPEQHTELAVAFEGEAELWAGQFMDTVMRERCYRLAKNHRRWADYKARRKQYLKQANALYWYDRTLAQLALATLRTMRPK